MRAQLAALPVQRFIDPLMIALAFSASVSIGLVAGGAGGLLLYVIAGLALVTSLVWAVGKPNVAFWLIAAQTIWFPIFPVAQGRGLTPLDILMPGTLLGAWLWYGNRRADGEHAEEAERARMWIVRAAMVYYAVAVFSLARIAALGRVMDALDSLLIMTRSVQGALFFFLVSRLARDRKGLEHIRNAIIVSLLIALVLNVWSMLLYHVPRAGAAWVFGTPGPRTGASWSVGLGGWVVTNPNELSMACLLVWALLLGMPLRRAANSICLTLTTVLLFLTLSRGGLAAWLVFLVAYGIRGGHRALWLLPILFAAALPALPDEYRGRILRTLTLERGSFEAFSTLIRFFCWDASFRTFLSSPIFGVGYLGFRFLSDSFNPLGLRLETSESFFLEIASGMGVLGLGALGYFAFSVVRSSRALRQIAQPGSVAGRFARIGPAYLLALGVANMTGDLLIGLFTVSQLALFLAFMTQSGRIWELRIAPTKGVG